MTGGFRDGGDNVNDYTRSSGGSEFRVEVPVVSITIRTSVPTTTTVVISTVFVRRERYRILLIVCG